MKDHIHNKKLIYFAVAKSLDNTIYCFKCTLLIFNKKQITEKFNMVFLKKKKSNILKQNKIKTALSSKARSVELAA